MNCKTFLFLVFVAFLLGLFFVPAYRDHAFLHLPIFTSLDSARDGVLPAFLHPGLNGGQPLAGDPNMLALYPTGLLAAFLPGAVVYGFHFFLHLFLSGWWMFLIARENQPPDRAAVTMLAWVLCGPFLSAAVSMNLFTAVALLPGLYFFAVTRFRPGAAALLIALEIFAGEWVLAGAAVLLVFSLSKEKRGVLADLVLGLFLALPLFLAVGTSSTMSFRVQAFSEHTALLASLHPGRLLGIFLPFAFGRSAEFSGGWWGSGYTNAPDFLLPTLFLPWVLLAAFLGSRKRVSLVVWQVVFLFFALGVYNPAVRLLMEHVSWFRLLRFPVKLILPAVFLLFVQVRWERMGRIRVFGAGLFCTLVSACLILFMIPGGEITLHWAVILGVQWLLLPALLLREQVRAAALSAGLILSGLLFLLPLPGLDRRVNLRAGEEAVSRLADCDVYDATEFSVYARGFFNFHRFARHAYDLGLAPTALGQGVRYRFSEDVAGSWSVLDRLVTERVRAGTWEEKVRILRAHGVERVITTEEPEVAGVRRLWSDGRTWVYAVEDPLPPVYVVPRAVGFPNPQEAVDFLASEAFDPETTVILPGEKGGGEPGPMAAVPVYSIEPDRVEISLTLDRPGYLVLRRSYFPGFRFFLDGKEVRALVGNVSLTAFSVPEGKHTLTGAVKKRGFYASLLLAFLTLLGVGYRACASTS